MSNSHKLSVEQLEDALAKALHSSSFEVVAEHGERYLEPIFHGLQIPIEMYPRLSLSEVARDMERYLS